MTLKLSRKMTKPLPCPPATPMGTNAGFVLGFTKRNMLQQHYAEEHEHAMCDPSLVTTRVFTCSQSVINIFQR